MLEKQINELRGEAASPSSQFFSAGPRFPASRTIRSSQSSISSSYEVVLAELCKTDLSHDGLTTDDDIF